MSNVYLVLELCIALAQVYLCTPKEQLLGLLNCPNQSAVDTSANGDACLRRDTYRHTLGGRGHGTGTASGGRSFLDCAPRDHESHYNYLQSEIMYDEGLARGTEE